MAIGSVPAEQRFGPKDIFLVALARTQVYKKHGMARVLCGVDKEGVQHDEPCYARDMAELDKGVWIEFPDDVHGGTMRRLVFLWDITFAADMLGKQSLLPFYETPSAHKFCGACDYDSTTEMAKVPFSFLRRPTPRPGAPKSQVKGYTQRTTAELVAMAKAMRRAGPKERERLMKAAGFNKIYYAWDPEYIEGADPASVPTDLLHLFPDGLLRSEAAWLFFILFALGLDIDRVNAAIRGYRGFPKDTRIPNLHAKLKEGKAGRPRSASTLRMTGSQVMHFTLHRFADALAMQPAACLSPMIPPILLYPPSPTHSWCLSAAASRSLPRCSRLRCSPIQPGPAGASLWSSSP